MNRTKQKRPAATLDDMGEAYRAFLGDADARTKMGWLLPELYLPIRRAGLDRIEKLSFGEFLELNRTRVELYEKGPVFVGQVPLERAVHA